MHKYENLRDLLEALVSINEAAEVVDEKEQDVLAEVSAHVLEKITGKGYFFNVFIVPKPDIDRYGFRASINGWYYSKAENAPKAGASQSQAHAQLLRFTFPIERAPMRFRRQVGPVRVFTLADTERPDVDGWGTGIALETDHLRVFIADKSLGTP